MRPRGSYGEVARALLVAAQHSPGPVRELAERACVGYGAARYTASRLVSGGNLVPLGLGRPAVLAVPAPAAERPATDREAQASAAIEALVAFARGAG